MDKTMFLKVGLAALLIVGAFALCALGKVTGPEALDFAKIIGSTSIVGIAVLGGAQSVASAMNGGTLPSTSSAPATATLVPSIKGDPAAIVAALAKVLEQTALASGAPIPADAPTKPGGVA